MASVVTSYSPANVKVIIGGYPLTGFAEDTFVDIEPAADIVTDQAGADGEIARSVSTDKRHTVTVTLQQGSAANDVLSGYVQLDQLGSGQLLPLTVVDVGGRTVFQAPQAWVRRRPNITFAREVGDRTWVFGTGEPSVFQVGGSF